MAIPVILTPLAKLLPLLKIAALGLVKLVFLLIGSILAPLFTFRLLNNMTIPTVIKIISHLVNYQKVPAEEAKTNIIFLEKVLHSAKEEDLSRPEARAILLEMQKNIVSGLKDALLQPLRWLKKWRRELKADK